MQFLADDMGLGKTLSMIALILKSSEKEAALGREAKKRRKEQYFKLKKKCIFNLNLKI